MIYQELALSIDYASIKIEDSTVNSTVGFVQAVLTNHPLALVNHQLYSEVSPIVKATSLINASKYTITTTSLPMEKISQLAEYIQATSSESEAKRSGRRLTLNL